jgi:hypothetical protein
MKEAESVQQDIETSVECECSQQGTAESSGTLSRRDFARKAAEVAAISVFGVLGFDALFDRVMSAIARDDSYRGIGSVAAESFTKVSKRVSAAAGKGGGTSVLVASCNDGGTGNKCGKDDGWVCHAPHNCGSSYSCILGVTDCSDVWTCIGAVECNDTFTCNPVPGGGGVGCTGRQFYCDDGASDQETFSCYTNFTCLRNVRYFCTDLAQPYCVLGSQYHNC